MSETTKPRVNAAVGKSAVQRFVMPDSGKWIVCWKYKDESAQGHGEPVSKYDAEQVVEWANDSYPTIDHWMIRA